MKRCLAKLLFIILSFSAFLNQSCNKKDDGSEQKSEGQWKLIHEFDRLDYGNVFWTDLDMVDENIGYASASYARASDIGLYKTINGGVNWIKLSNPATDTEITWRTVFFLDANTGWVGGSGYSTSRIYKTINGGQTWTKQTDRVIDGKYLFSGPYNIYFSDAQHGVAVGSYGSLIYTEDGGNSWHWATTEYNHTQGNYAADIYGVWAVGNTFWDQELLA